MDCFTSHAFQTIGDIFFFEIKVFGHSIQFVSYKGKGADRLYSTCLPYTRPLPGDMPAKQGKGVSVSRFNPAKALKFSIPFCPRFLETRMNWGTSGLYLLPTLSIAG